MLKTGYITDALPMHTAAMSAYPYSSDLEARYTFKTKFDETVCMAVKQGNTLLVPRETVPVSKNDYRVSYPPIAIDCKFTPKHEEQGVLSERSIGLLKAGVNHIFDAPTGWGKTVVGSYIAIRMGQPTLIVVNKDDLVQQWKSALIKVLKVDPKLVGHIQQDVCDWKGKMFVVGMVQSLIIPDKYPPEMLQHFGMNIFDEVDRLAADTFIQSVRMFPAKYRLGFSATVDRTDGKSKLLYAHIGPVMVKGTIVPMKPRVLIRHTGWKIPVTRQKVGDSWEYLPIPHAPGRMVQVYKAMASNPVRNAEIVTFALQAYKAGRVILVLSDLIEGQLHKLFHLFTKAGVPGEEIGYYISGLSDTKINHAKNAASIVLGTYLMCSTGTDVPRWDTLIMANPRANVKQPVGRVLRTMEGKRQPVVLELVDNEKILHNFHLSRLKQYYEIGAELVKIA